MSKGKERSFIVYRIVETSPGSHEIQNVKDQAKTKKPTQSEHWNDFVTELSSKADDAAYGVFALEYMTRDDRPTDGILFVKFMDEDNVKVRRKMLYGSTMMSFKRELQDGFVMTLEASTPAELDLDEIMAKLKKL